MSTSSNNTTSPAKNSRRDFVKKFAAGGMGMALFQNGAHAATSGDSFTFVHLTDMHVRSARRGDDGYRECIKSVNALDPQPEFVLMGGDMAFDGLYTEKEEFARQIALFEEISNDLNMPYFECIGNHDVLGLNSRREVPIDDPDLGKKMIMDRLGMERSYYSFNYNGWHFVVLDTIFQVQAEHGPGYIPKLGQHQLNWLRRDLGASSLPTVCVMHIAAFCNLGQIEGDTDAPAMNHMVIQDNRAFREICERHDVRAVLQGHSHRIEDYYYNGVWYVTSQAVSAAWWGGNWRGFEPGYTIFTVCNDEITWERQTFEWEHHLEPEDDLERERIQEREEFIREQERLLQKDRSGEVGIGRREG